MQIFTYKKEGFANLNIYVDRVNDQGLFFMCDFQSTSMKEWVMDGFDWELGARTFEQMEEMGAKLGAELHIFENGVEVLPSEEPVEPIEVIVKPTYRESDPQSENPGDFIEGENGGTVEVVENEESENEYTITATPKTGYNKQGGWDFLRWYDEKGDLFSTDLSYTFATEKSVALTARFQKRWFTQTWRKNANVKSLTFEGARRVPYYTEDVNTMTLPDDTDQYAYGIDGWYVQGGKKSSNASYSTPASNDMVIEARGTAILKQHTITVTSEDEEGGTVSGGGTFDYGVTTTVVATPVNLFFDGWYVQGTLVSSDPEYTFTVTASIELVAKWKNTVTVTPVIEPTNSGTLNPSAPFEVEANASASITVTPAAGYLPLYAEWHEGDKDRDDEDLPSRLRPFVFSRSQVPGEETGYFKLTMGEVYTITPTVEPEGAGTVTPNPIESVENFPLSIKATPAEGKVFTKFVISGKESTTNPWQGWLDPGETVVAFFEDAPTT